MKGKKEIKVDVKERAKELVWWIADLSNQKKSIDGLLEGAREELKQIMIEQGWDKLKDNKVKKQAEIQVREVREWDLEGLCLIVDVKDILKAVRPIDRKILNLAKKNPDIMNCGKVKEEKKILVFKDLKEKEE